MFKSVFLLSIALLVSVFAFALLPSPTFAADTCSSSRVSDDDLYARRLDYYRHTPSLSEFTTALRNAQPEAIVGVYVCDVLALRIDQQPSNDPVYVSNLPATATQFGLAAQYGTIGLLAHNDRAGSEFFNLAVGQTVDIIRGDGSVQRYIVTDIRHFQSLNPDDPYSNFIDLDHSGVQLSSTQVFQQVFARGDRVVFQTCIAVDGKLSWGRLFVTAQPLE